MKKILFLILGIAIFMTGCTAAPTVAPLERSQMRTATIDADYDTTFRSLMTTLEDQGYTIENTDMQSGLIKASVSKDATSGFQKFMGSTGVDTYEVSSTVTKINATTTKVRINIREKTDISTATGYGSNESKTANEIDDPMVYKNLFDELKTDIARAKAMK
jgi:hypothetical protein